MTKWWILIAAAAVAEITFALFIWSYRPALPSEAVFTSMEAAQAADMEQMDAFLRSRGAAADPRAAWASYVGALYLGDYKTAYGFLSRRSRSAFEASGGLASFEEAHRRASARYDLGKTLPLAQTEDAALIAAQKLNAAERLRIRLRHEDGQWRIEARPSPDGALLTYPVR